MFAAVQVVVLFALASRIGGLGDAMRVAKVLALVAGAALFATGCASTPDLVPAKHVTKRDMDACDKAAETAANEPGRRQQQQANANTGFMIAGLSGMFVTAAVQGAQDSGVEAQARNACLAKKGYKLVPAKN